MEAGSDLAVSAAVWNNPNESLTDVNRRIHDGVPLHRLEERARNYVAHILDLFPYAEVKPGSSILEIGSGTGYIMSAMDAETRSRGAEARQIVGLDIAEHMIAKAQIMLGKNPRFRFVHYDGITVPIDDRSFDLIYSVAALQHAPKPYVYNLFFEIKRLLKNDGHAIIHLLGFKQLPEQEKAVSWRSEITQQVTGAVGHWHHYYSAEELKYVFGTTGFMHSDIRDLGPIWSLVQPRALALPSNFDPARYLDMNPDVAAGGGDPAAHWIRFGHREGRRWAE